MTSINEEVSQLYKNCIARIESDMAEGRNFSFHHYATKYGLKAQRLQEEWTAHSHAKRNGATHELPTTSKSSY